MSYKIILSYLSVLLNLLYMGSWIYISGVHEDFEDSQVHFDAVTWLPGYYREALLFVLTIFSILIFGKRASKTDRIFLVVQLILGFMLVWQFL